MIQEDLLQRSAERAEALVAHVHGLTFGTLVSYEELDRLGECESRKLRGWIYRAVRRLEAEHHRTLIVVVGKGYRVAYPKEHIIVALGRVRRGRSQFRRGAHTVGHTDVSYLSAQERVRCEWLEQRLRMMDQAAYQTMRHKG